MTLIKVKVTHTDRTLRVKISAGKCIYASEVIFWHYLYLGKEITSKYFIYLCEFMYCILRVVCCLIFNLADY